MPQPSRLVVLAVVGLILSICFALFPLFIIDDGKEIERPTTICSGFIISPKFNASTLQSMFSSKDEIEIAMSFSISLPRPAGIDYRTSYNVSLQPVVALYPEVLTVDTGVIAVKDQTIVTTRFTIPKALVDTHKSWELTVATEETGDKGTAPGVNRVYLSFADHTKDTPRVTVVEPADYWFSRISEIGQPNSTFPNIRGNNETLNCDCEKNFWLPTDTALPAPGGGPIDPPPRQVSIPVRIQVRFKMDSSPASASFPLAGAKVVLGSTDESLTLYPTWEFILDSQGRANGLIKTLTDQIPVGAKLYFEDSLFTLKAGTNQGNLQRWEAWLDLLPGGSGLTVRIDEILPFSLGPDIGHLWTEFHRIRSSGEASVGLWDVPHIDVWYPSNGINSFYNNNQIQMLSGHSRIPAIYAHEYGHHVMQSLMTGGIPSVVSTPTHAFCPGVPISPGMAFVEGYATAFGLQVLGTGMYGSIDIANYQCATNRDMPTDEGRVAAGMLDLIDDDAASPECSTNADFGRTDRCDRTRGSQLFTPRVVLRDSLIGPQISSVNAWWNRLLKAHPGELGIADGREAMEYNYYPPSGRICKNWLSGNCNHFPFSVLF